jgi:hypothetical protein
MLANVKNYPLAYNRLVWIESNWLPGLKNTAA